MELIADGLLIAATSTAALYCWVLSRRLIALKNLDDGLGGAIASLSAQVEETRASLDSAKSQTGVQTHRLKELAMRAEAATQKLEATLTAVQKTEMSASPDRKTEQPLVSTEAASPLPHDRSEKREIPMRTNVAENIFNQGNSLFLDAYAPTPKSLGVHQETDVTQNGSPKPASSQSSEVNKSALITRLRGLAETAAP